MTFRNTAGPHNEQAVAFLSGSDHSAVYNCSMEGYQDTLYTAANKQFYKNCKIFGTVDFIFGDALAVFQDCEIFVRKTVPRGGLVVTAHGRKYHNESTGYCLQGCTITVAADLKPFISEYSKAFLGRPWHPYAFTMYMESFIDDLVDPQGWLDTWGYNETTFCGEYMNYGPGASTDQRVKWRGYHVINDPNIAKYFTVSKFILGNQWLPETGVPFISAFQIL
uniref:pectinesterase 2-like n=1 Tax=Erigeron canadensis TaxID=72917 RepID=UPI001CB97A1D|nr:pectinesterase 2-like [Erigeron canadensis]